ncbi:hypothetical protein [Sporanaerobacter acetigenes]|uniref:Uncharacterized protein n=1 Tax=Sporanaerobacter acetigenes DSM 13106 TaxID=1123281 RepID=A0A1M5YQ19_9FIRM|nr:hypothetical protein [Sporanaerobacter acetigenes]SHI14172.1 hypothetical protein SAMN02745180_02366 [Sporanaerobacter acetigenes DSM 13106]
MLLMIRIRENGSVSKEITSFSSAHRDKIISPSTYIYLEKGSSQSPVINAKSNEGVEVILCFNNRDFGIVNSLDILEGYF